MSFLTQIRLIRLILFLSILFTSIAAPARAQRNPCSWSALHAILKKFVDAGQPASDTEYQASLRTLETIIRTQSIACLGMTFSGNGAKLLGPIDLPAGLYKVTAKTDDAFLVKMRILKGLCTASNGENLYAFFAGDGAAGAETIIESSTCTILLETDVAETWSLTIEPLQ